MSDSFYEESHQSRRWKFVSPEKTGRTALLTGSCFVRIVLRNGWNTTGRRDSPAYCVHVGVLRTLSCATPTGGKTMATDGMGLWQSLFVGLSGSKAGLPRDTNTITVLRVEQATSLVKNHSGVLQLNGLTSITPTVAGILARYRGVIFLNGLLSVPVQVATRLAKHRGPLYLGSIEDITEEARKALHGNTNVHYRDRESYEDSVDMPDLDGM